MIYYRADKDYSLGGETLNGGKVRQFIALVEENKEYIVRNCNNTIATASSLFNPQSIIAAAVSKQYGFKCIIGFGGGRSVEDTAKDHSFFRLSQELGADCRVVSKLGYNSAIYGALNKMQKEEGFYNVGFGLASEDPNSPVLKVIQDSVLDLPKGIKTLVVLVGLGIQFGAILTLYKYNLHKDIQLVGIQIAGKDRTKDLNDIVQRSGVLKFMQKPKYEFYLDHTYDYHDLEDFCISGTDRLSGVYEAKAALALKACLPELYKEDSTCFYVIGNDNIVRQKYSNKPLKFITKNPKELEKVKIHR